MMPIPIILPMGGGGTILVFGGFVFILLMIISCFQVIVATFRLFEPTMFDDGEYKSVYEYLYWCIPILPCLMVLINKLRSLNKKGE